MTNLEELQTGCLENPAFLAHHDKSLEEIRYEYYQAHNIGKGDQLRPATAPLKEDTIFQELEDTNFEDFKHYELLKNCSIDRFKDKSTFPGFEDTCFEEVRSEFCEAIKNGSVDQYKQTLQMALQKSTNRIKALINVLTEISNGNGSFTTGTFPTNTSQSRNVFMQTNQETWFSQTQPSTLSIFAAAIQCLSPSAPQQSIFGRSSKNVFASAASTPNRCIFGDTAIPLSVPQTNSPFERQTISSLSVPQTSLFGEQTTTSPLSISQTSLLFQMNKDNSPFGENPSLTSSSFPAQVPNSAFGSPFGDQTTSSPVRISQTSLPFQTNKDSSPFGENSNSTSSSFPTQVINSPFGSPFREQTTSSLSISQTSLPFQTNKDNSPFGENSNSTSPSLTAQMTNSPLMEQKESPSKKKKRKRPNSS